MNPITVSAPGKLMLLGEHAVVYDHPCLVTAADLRIYVTITPSDQPFLTIYSSTNSQPYRFDLAHLTQPTPNYPSAIAFVMAAIVQITRQIPLAQGINLTTTGPTISYGLGSSSAVTVATLKALAEFLGLSLTTQELFQLAYQAVLAVQKKASGFDLAAAIYGGTLYFRTGGKQIEPLAIPSLPIVVGYSGSKVGTVNLVQEVYQLYQALPWAIDPIFQLSEQIVEEARHCLLARDWERLGKLVNIGQGLADSLGVNSRQLSDLIFAAREAGALGAKLSGAGGGDCMFALVTEQSRPEVEAAITAAGGQLVRLPLNGEGVRLENQQLN